MKPGPKDIRVYLKFDDAELELLQENTWQMAESFGLDRRIANLTGKRQVGFYMWDLECLEMVVGDLRNEKDVNLSQVECLYGKIKDAMDFIEKSGQKK
jgi:hypothetical protein